MEALKFRRRTFLERPEWKSVPWELSPQLKDSSQYLEDILADLPGIGDDLDTWKFLDASVESPITIIRLGGELRASILNHLQQVIEWRWIFEIDNPSVAQVIPVDPATSLTIDEDSRPLFPTVFHFADLHVANTILQYNTIILWLLRAASHVLDGPFSLSMIPLLGGPPERTNPLNLPGKDPTDGTLLAHEVCQSLEYRILRVRSSAVAFPLLLPLRVASVFSDPESKEAKWLVRLAGVIEQRSGLEVGNVINS